MKNEKLIMQKIQASDEVLVRMMQNVVKSEYDDYNRQLKKDAASLKKIADEIEWLIGPELIET